MKLGPIIKILGYFLLMLSISMIIPALFSLATGDGEIWNFLLSLIICLVVGGAMALLPKKASGITFQDGFALVTFSWVLLSIFGGLPYMLGGHVSGITDAFFETMSGFTTTGGSIFKDVTALPSSVILWRSMTQWFGGMGIVVLFLAVVPFFDTGGMSLYQAEVAGPVVEKLRPRLEDTAKILWLGYLSITTIGTGLLWLSGMNLFDAVNHAMTSVSTGGFSNRANSIEYYDSALIEFIIIVLMIIGCTNFTLHYRFCTRRLNPREYGRDTEFMTMIALIALFTVLVAAFNLMEFGGDLGLHFRQAAFNIVSVISSTGFSSADFNLWPLASHMLLLVLMCTGGCAGSTTGGIKLIRIVLVFKTLKREFLKMLHPNGVFLVKVNRVNISPGVISSTISFVLIYLLCAVASVALLSIETQDFMTAFSAVLACLGNIGPGLGQVGPAGNFADLSTLSKWVLSFDMLIGRLEIMTVLILFYPRFWQHK